MNTLPVPPVTIPHDPACKAFGKPPVENQIMYVCGIEFVAVKVRIIDCIEERTNKPYKICRYQGIMTENPRNDQLRASGYNGGIYGYRIA